MKKFLFTLCVMMLTCIGTWAQGSPQTIDKELYVGDVLYWAPGNDVQWTTSTQDVDISNFAIKSGDEEYVAAVLENGSYKLTGLKKTTTPATITFTATNYQWGRGVILETIECTANVVVNGYNCVISITPDPSGGISLNKGQTSTIYNLTTDWKKGDASTGQSGTNTVMSSETSIATVEYHSWDNTFFLNGVSDGETSVTVKSEYQGQVETVIIPVSVSDPTIAKSINADDITMAYGTEKPFTATLFPTTATNYTSVTCNIPGVTCEKVGDIVNGVIQFNINATSISEETSGTITITAGTVTKVINLTLKAPVTLSSITIDPNTAQKIQVGDNFTITLTPDPVDATFSTEKAFDSSIISCVGETESITVTGIKPGKTTLTITPDGKPELAQSIEVTVTQPITDAAVAIDVPASTRVGVTGAKAVVKVNEAVAGSDFNITYASSNEAAVRVNTAGELEFVGAGSATITATLTPNASTTYYTGTTTIESAEITVGAPITANWTGSINQSLELGSQNSQVCPTVTWSETVTNGQTIYTINSDDETIVKGVKVNENLLLGAIKAGSANITISAEYGFYDHVNAGGAWATLATSSFGPIAVTVSPITGEISLSPSDDFTMEVNDATKSLEITASWSDGTTPTINEPSISGDDVVTAVLGYGAKTVVNVTPKKPTTGGTATVTVTSTWTKALDYPFSESATLEKTVSFNVTVFDKTLATSLTAPANQNVQKGKSTNVAVAFAPSTAEFQTPTSDYDKVTVAYQIKDTKTNYRVLVVSAAANAEIGHTATITLTPKDGSSAEAKTFTVTVVKPELPVSDVMPNTTFRVGETYETELTMGGDLVLNQDYTQAYSVSENNGANGTDAISLDPSTGEIHALNVGSAKISSRFTPIENTTAAEEYDVWTREMTVYVKPGEFGLTINTNLDGTSATTAISATTLNGTAFTGTPADYYTIEYSLEDAPVGVTINTATGEVSNIPTTPCQFAVVATLTPKSTTNYIGAVAKAAILVNGTASAGVVLSKSTITVKDADGNDVEEELIIVNVPTPGAFGEISDEPTYTSTDGTTLQMLKDAKNVKVTGLLANSDVQELVNLIGSHVQNVSDYANCETLDMGNATMTEEVTSANYKCSWVNTSNSKSLGSVKDLILPKPAPGYTVLPSYTMSLVTSWNTNSKNSLQTLTIPEGWTETAAVFSCFQNTGETTFGENKETGKTGLTTLNLPNSLEKIGDYSFADICVQTLYMPKNIKYIGAFAFSPTSKMQDIYFTGDGSDLKYIDRNAFSSQTQLCNNSVNDQAQNGKHMPTINRGNYVNGNVPVCIMHYPKGCDAEYTDVTRSYIVLDTSGNGTGEYAFPSYTKGGNTYTPKGEYEDGTTWKWDNDFEELVNSKVYSNSWSMKGIVLDGAFPDDTYGYSFIWPSQSQMTYGYAIANAGYLWNMQPMSREQLDPENGIDKRGLYQFIIGMGNAPKDKDKWVFNEYEKNKWYTFSVPFDMTVEQIKKAFGEKTQVCRISKVIRDTTDPNKKVLRLEFRKSVMQENFTKPEDIRYHDGVEQAGIRHHWPYMIKPGGTTAEIDPSFQEDGHRILPDYQTIPGNLMIETVTSVNSDDTSSGHEYMFCPILMEGKLKKNSYVLTNKNDIHQFIFYKGTKNKTTGLYEDGGKASANTAYVQLIHGQADNDDYFPTGTISGAPKLSFFGDEEDATGIEKIEIVCGAENVANDKIYTIGGQLVNGNNLPAGIYIKNGKKFIVK